MSTLAGRRRPDQSAGDDGVAIVMSMAYIAVFTTLMLTMLAVVLGQVTPTAQARKDVGSLNAAASGLQAGLANLRSARDENGVGDPGRLPCQGDDAATFRSGGTSDQAAGAVLSGIASGLPGNFSYEVHLAYYREDPTDKPPAWLADHALSCALGQTPSYAYLQAYGVGDDVAGTGGSRGTRGDRSQTGVYRFWVPAANTAGGRLRQYGHDLCLDAGDLPVAAGRQLTFQQCKELGSRPGQLWDYRADLTLFFRGDPANKLCVQGTPTEAPALRRCTGSGDGSTYPYAPGQQAQLWSYNDRGHFAGAGYDGDVSDHCLQPTGPGAAAAVLPCPGETAEYGVFDPDPSIGAGKAGGNTTGIVSEEKPQYVNGEVGRCLHVTVQDVPMISLNRCQQVPDSTKRAFNQVWTWTEVNGGVGRLSITTPSTDGEGWRTDHCLTAPAGGPQVEVGVCDLNAPDQEWTATRSLPDDPGLSYHLISRSGLCLSVDGVSGVVLEACSAAGRQRWNAPPPTPDAGLNDVQEGESRR